MKVHVAIFSIALLVLASVPVRAHQVILSQPDPECACFANGKRFAQKQVVCIRGFRMVCGMSGNVTSWLPLNEACQVSSRDEKKLLLLRQ